MGGVGKIHCLFGADGCISFVFWMGRNIVFLKKPMNNNPLTLEILCAHMAYGLTSRYGQDGTNYPPIAIERFWRHGTTGEIWIGPNASFLGIELKEAKLLLRPLSDLIDDKETFLELKELGIDISIGYLSNYGDLSMDVSSRLLVAINPMTVYKGMNLLLSKKYDLFGGIASGWALDLNTYGK